MSFKILSLDSVTRSRATQYPARSRAGSSDESLIELGRAAKSDEKTLVLPLMHLRHPFFLAPPVLEAQRIKKTLRIAGAVCVFIIRVRREASFFFFFCIARRKKEKPEPPKEGRHAEKAARSMPPNGSTACVCVSPLPSLSTISRYLKSALFAVSRPATFFASVHMRARAYCEKGFSPNVFQICLCVSRANLDSKPLSMKGR